MRVGIIILSWNSKKMIDECLSGLLAYERYPVYVVDNGSKDGSPEYIAEKYPNVELIKSPVNLGFSSGNNLGIVRALEDGCDAVLLLNNDTLIDDSFLEPCIKAMKDDPTIGVAGPVVVEGNQPETIQCAGGNINLLTLGFPYIGKGKPYKRRKVIQDVGYVLGAVMLIRREVIEKIGVFDPEYYPAYVEEADLCYRARRKGYRSVICHEVRVRHIGEQSGGTYNTAFRRYTKNRFLFGLKHLGPVRFLCAGLLIVVNVFIKKIMGKL